MSIKQIKCKLYLEGIEVPFNSISITEKIQQPTTARISLPANDRFLYILPKTIAHVFYSDTGDAPYYLIFEGMLDGFDFGRSATQRSINAIFSSYSSELNRAYLQKLIPTTKGVGASTITNRRIMNVGVTSVNHMGENVLAGLKKIKEDIGEYKSEPVVIPYRISDVIPPTTILNVFLSRLGLENSTIKDALSELMATFINNNTYYELMQNTLKVIERINVLPNTIGATDKQDQVVANSVLVELLHNQEANYPDVIGANEVLNKILPYLGYEWVDLAAPTWIDGKPTSFIFKPDMSYMLPIVNNVIMPYEVSDMYYSRNMMAEPTRTILQTMPLPMKLNQANTENMMTSVVSPAVAIDFYDDPNGNPLPIGVPTNEEKVRGFQPRYGQYDNGVSKILASMGAQARTQDAESTTVPFYSKHLDAADVDDASVMKTDSSQRKLKYLSYWADKSFFDSRYASRSCNLSIAYSPYRMVGFPALVVDKILPSIYGTIESIESSISADGNASQRISIKSPKLITSLSNTAKPELLDIYGNFIPQFPYCYSTEIYDSKTIGSNIYNELIGEDAGGADVSSLLSLIPEANTKDLKDITSLLIAAVNYLKILMDDEQNARNSLDRARLRTLCEEGKFWKFLGRTGTDADVYEAEALTVIMKDNADQTVGSLQKPAEGKVFSKERRGRVKFALLKKGMIYNV